MVCACVCTRTESLCSVGVALCPCVRRGGFGMEGMRLDVCFGLVFPNPRPLIVIGQFRVRRHIEGCIPQSKGSCMLRNSSLYSCSIYYSTTAVWGNRGSSLYLFSSFIVFFSRLRTLDEMTSTLLALQKSVQTRLTLKAENLHLKRKHYSRWSQKPFCKSWWYRHKGSRASLHMCAQFPVYHKCCFLQYSWTQGPCLHACVVYMRNIHLHHLHRIVIQLCPPRG